jgi:O-Antigen ligase
VTATEAVRQPAPAVDAGYARVRWEALPAGIFAFVVILTLGLSSGGYWSRAWGWSSLAALWLVALALLFGQETKLGALPVAWLCALLGVLLWIEASVGWSASQTRTMLEGERTVVYVAAATAVLLLVRGRGPRPLLLGTWASVTGVCGYALLGRLFPERFGIVSAIAGVRLSEPIGYWNALGVFAAVGALLALGLAARERSLFLRLLAAASTPVLVLTTYFTFSRGAWIALALGLLFAIALDPRRLQLITASLAPAATTAVAVAIAYRSSALTHVHSRMGAATHQGHRLAFYLGVLMGVTALLTVLIWFLERRLTIARAVRLAYAAALVVAAAIALSAIFVRYGSPASIASRAYHSFSALPPAATNNLNQRLFNLSGNLRVPQWHVAWRQYKAHPLLGSGAGTYELYWLQQRHDSFKVRDVHNLYLETLAELGPVGLALVLAVVGLPLVAAFLTRRDPLVPAAAGGFVALFAHAAIDWDWELPAVTLAGLFCGAALLAARPRAPGSLSPRVRAACLAATVALGAFAFVGLVGNSALHASAEALQDGKVERAAAQARKAERWAPWSAEPWLQLALAELRLQHGDAQRSLEQGIDRDPRDWNLWYLLALESVGRSRGQALATASRLNPHGPEIQQLRAALGTTGR